MAHVVQDDGGSRFWIREDVSSQLLCDYGFSYMAMSTCKTVCVMVVRLVIGDLQQRPTSGCGNTGWFHFWWCSLSIESWIPGCKPRSSLYWCTWQWRSSWRFLVEGIVWSDQTLTFFVVTVLPLMVVKSSHYKLLTTWWGLFFLFLLLSFGYMYSWCLD
jgi:hypothetical protein